MRKVFVDELPHKGKFIDWENCVGCKVKFIYNNIKGEVTIVYYKIYNKKPIIIICYDNRFYSFHTSNFTKCKLNYFLKVQREIITPYKFNVNDIIKVKSGYIKILKQTRIRHGENLYKAYKCKCLNEKCCHIYTIIESHIENKIGCGVCSNNIVKKGVNDMQTKMSNMAKMLKEPKDGYKYSFRSNEKINWICPNCGTIIIDKSPNEVFRRGLSCKKCSDNMSYPEKFVLNLLEQLNINFIFQLTKTIFEWCGNYRYDFYTPKINAIIETHGMQHYEEGFGLRIKKARTLKEEQENDKFKKELAVKNGIKNENYIVVDCRYSTLKWIKDEIMNSELPKLLNFKEEDIDWLKCHEFACSSFVKKACDLWNSGIKNTKEIGKILMHTSNAIYKYLKQGAELGLCDYDPKKVMKANGIKTGISKRKKVLCITSDKIFDSIKQASEFYNLTHSNIISCCQGKRKSAGKHPITKEKLKWMYYDEYIEEQNKSA